jgi:adenosine deaminase
MSKHPLSRLRIAVTCLAFIIVCACGMSAQTTAQTEKTAHYFESVRNSPPTLFAFLLQMPKGGDLHSHLSGTVYAESYIQWAAADRACVNPTTMVASQPCKPGDVPVTNALTNSVLFQQIVDAWSMRNWQTSGDTGHDHFFATFGKFAAATYDHNGTMLAEAVTRAAHGHVLYLELMLTPDGNSTGVLSTQIAANIKWDGNLTSALSQLKAAGIDRTIQLSIDNLNKAEAEKNSLLKCGTPQPDPGCAVMVRYIAQVARGAASQSAVFAQMVTGFALANDANSKVLALNLVQAEDSPGSVQNFKSQMQMLQFLRPMYPNAHLSLHAGELAPGLVAPDVLAFHIHDSVTVAQANRIGHGVDVMHETDADGLLKEMARRNVMVEICLTSNDVILGISGREHPLATYLKYGVPVALATDDEGVSRSEISREYLRAVQDQNLGYLQLKMMDRNSLEYAFIAGASLWSDAKKTVPVTQCASDFTTMTLNSLGCRQFIEGSEKAKLQWKLEEELRAFESKW